MESYDISKHLHNLEHPKLVPKSECGEFKLFWVVYACRSSKYINYTRQYYI